jgi:Zn-dependent peptidase ImmA (M78 family)/transcriptional regulator with XRE-family HTH domain
MVAVKPEILIWARETAGLSLSEAAHKLGIGKARGMEPDERLAALERGDGEVSRPMLLKMAKQYRRPLVTFYLREAPARGDRGEDFRTLPEREDGAEAIVDALLRDVRARQGMVRAILEDDEDAEPLPFVGSVEMKAGVETVARAIRRTVDIDLPKFRAQNSPESAFALLREKVETLGVFVVLAGNLGSYHTALDVEVFRGFALSDEFAPFIVINDLDARPAWSFTLLHELTHIWLGQTGISGSYSESQVERFCNEVASHLLLQTGELEETDWDIAHGPQALAKTISEFAAERNLSRSMVAYRLHGAGILSRGQWQVLRAIFRQQWQQARAARRDQDRDREGGPNYYLIRRHRIGAALLKFVAQNLSAGSLSVTKASRVLGVKPRSVAPLLSGAALPVGRAA